MSARRGPRALPAALALAIAIAIPALPVQAAPEAAAPAAFPDRSARLIGLARVWAHARWYHPYLAHEAIDWDAALVAAIPKVEAAADEAAYRAALAGMLKALGDPASTVLPATAAAPPAPAAAPAPPPAESITWPTRDIMHVDLRRMLATPGDFRAAMVGGQLVVNEAPRARAIIVDLGDQQPEDNAWLAGWAVDQMKAAFPATSAWPTERIVEHRGFRTQDGATSGDYRSLFISVGGAPPRKGPAKGPGHVVFVIRDGVPVPALALALQAEGRATLIATRKLDDASVVSTTEVAAAGGVRVRLRLGELEWGAVAADTVVARGKDPSAAALAAARASLGKRASPRRRAAPSLPPFVYRDDADYAATPYPSRELRMLAAIRLWTIIDQFEPYRYLIADWDGALRDGLAAVVAATDADGYRTALREMAARVRDGHVGVYPADRASAPPSGIPPFTTRMVEGKLAIAAIVDAAAAAKLGVAPGDVVETIDGKPAADALAALRSTQSASNDEFLAQRVAMRVLSGPDGSTVTLGVRGARGPRREVVATRALAHQRLVWEPPPAPAWKLLPDDVGYVDLMRLEVAQVPAMFAALAATRAIVFDLRGYPNGTAWPIAPRINTRKATYGASFLQPLRAGQGGELDDKRIRFLQKLPDLPAGATVYAGKVVVLIDDRAISQSEHTCLFFQEAAGATFVGSPTAGANGDVTVARLPGGLRMSITGQEVRHVDGKQLQQVGIQPHVVVRPTLAGLRAGKDEVLERALVRIKTGT